MLLPPTVHGTPVSRAGGFTATRYGVQYEGLPLGCPRGLLPAGRPDGLYHSADPSIMAAPPARYDEWPCGTYYRVTNPANGAAIVVVRVDACPGCGPQHIDLSEAGLAMLCGVTWPATCDYLAGLVVERLK